MEAAITPVIKPILEFAIEPVIEPATVRRPTIVRTLLSRYLALPGCLLSCLLMISLVLVAPVTVAETTLRVLNWSDYIDPDVIAEFEKRYDAKIDYVEYSSVDDFATRFLNSANHFDVIFPASRMIKPMASAGFLQEIDTRKIAHMGDLRVDIREEFQRQDTGQWHGIPYMWGTTGLGINRRKLEAQQIDPNDIGWSLLFDPDVREKAARCGIVVLNERDELFAAALRFMGESINATSREVLTSAGTLIKDAMADIKYLHSSNYLDALEQGEACVVLGYSGDILSTIAEKPDLEYIIPSAGAAMWIDVMAIPANAPHPELAYQFINFLMQPEVAARNSNYLEYPTAMSSALPMVERSILDNPEVYPSQAVLAKLEAMKPLDKESSRYMQRLWVKAICSSGKYCSAPVDHFF